MLGLWGLELHGFLPECVGCYVTFAAVSATAFCNRVAELAHVGLGVGSLFNFDGLWSFIYCFL